MTAVDSSRDAIRVAAQRLGQHPQDHGWRELYRLIAYGLGNGHAPQLVNVVRRARAARHYDSDAHILTLLGIAIKVATPAVLPELCGNGTSARDRLAILEQNLEQARTQIDRVLDSRNNSFTGVRRFLVPQVLLAAYFARQYSGARFADLGTGLGILPRQLNCRRMFDLYAPSLRWPDDQPAFRVVPFEARFGVDRRPLPDLAWVRACYGLSSYYEREFSELESVLQAPELQVSDVVAVELDFTDPAALREFILARQINAVCICYSLYELTPRKRHDVIDLVADLLDDPGLILSIEPNEDLAKQGCTVTVRDHATPRPLAICVVSDGHFRGQVYPLADYHDFFSRYPIRLRQDVGSRDIAAT